ncbi:zinc finger HIT domain-containing protein 3 [Linepithema humile]|uniref:zinc finger HIT domain-containing protein 3 n=1 Tax=Linepithema humile TaxID=83485 RepID=UPI0006235A69|nr:PREDICTED: zinc finger HIT domain-containing protein 3 [Linepithema humile]XP_012224057.1 PREDICTED: zinc finger HIT domain-containing protein 3 [Linepithema humile]
MTLKNCCVCEKDSAPYKCPTCRTPYCSVACYKQHKSQPCNPPQLSEEPLNSKEDQNVVKREYKFPTEDTVLVEKLEKLRHSKELKEVLENPHVRDIMTTIMNSPNPTEMIALAMKEPIFVEMADACLKVVEPLDETGPF